MTAALRLDQRRPNRAEQLEHLRHKMAAVSGKVGGGRRGAAPSADQLPDSETLLPMPESLGRAASRPVAPRNRGGAFGRPVAAAEHGGGGDGGGRSCRDRRPARCRTARRRGDGSGPEQDRGHPRPGSRSGRGGCGADGRNGSGGPRPGRSVGARNPRHGRWSPGPGRRGARCWSRTGTGRERPPGWTRRSAATRSSAPAVERPHRDAGGSAGCGWPCGRGDALGDRPVRRARLR